MADADARMNHVMPLDDDLYVLNPEQISFLLAETRIETEDALKKHLIDVQAKAYKVHPYPCIRRFGFAKPTIARMPAYNGVLKLGQERENAIFMDIGCGFGGAIRKIVADGFPIDRVLGSDIQEDFWNLGHEVFRSTPETFPVPFVKGDVFDPLILELVPPFYDDPKTPSPQLSSLTSLNPLHGHVSSIYAASFFHLFSEDRQLKLARAFAGLLSPEPGSIIFGMHLGKSLKGFYKSSDGEMFYHSPDSWKELWDGEVFEKGKVEVEVFLRPFSQEFPESKGLYELLIWSVTRS